MILSRSLAGATFVITSLLAASAGGQANRAVPTACSLVTKADVFRVLGWSIESKEKKPYDMLGATGTMCFLASPQGEVIVTMPDAGTTYPGASVYSQADAAGLSRTVYGLGAEVVLYNGTVYVSKHHRKVAIRVVPNDHNASYDEVQGFAKMIVPRLK